MKSYNFLITLIIISGSAFFGSCKEVIEIDLNSSNPAINAEAIIEEDSVATVRLMYTSDYFDAEEPVYIENSTVTIEDDQGHTETLEYFGNGTYKGSLIKGISKQSYNISFTNEGKSYTANSELNTPVTIQNAFFQESEINKPTEIETAYNIVLNFTNDETKINHYLLKFVVNSEVINGRYNLLESENYSTNGMINYIPFRMQFEEGDAVQIFLYSIDEQTYIYYNHLNDISSGGMGGTSTPYSPSSNFGEGVMGFFEARSFTTWSGIVE